MTERTDHGETRLPCTSVLTLAYEYLDGETSPEQAAQVESHIGRCPECREHVERERAFLRSLRAGLAAEKCPAVVRDRIREAMRARRQSRDEM
jgi:mycothiol system anti-sigma-R factor